MDSQTDFIETTRRKMAAVVRIYAEGYVGEEVKSILNPRIGDLLEWSGSGFFIESEYGEGIIVTNAHVVKNAHSIEVMTMLTSEETFQAELVGMVENLEPDVAIIRLTKQALKKFKSIASDQITYLQLACESPITRGTGIKAIGYPMGMTEPNITGGEITNFVSGDRIQSEKYVTDAAINPGNSGGPAINREGKVVGINTSIYQEADNIGFITPCAFIEIILKNIFENNTIRFSDIGGSFQKNSLEVSKQFGMEENRGIIVTTIDKGGFLENAKLKEEDVILGLNGQQIDRHGIFISKEHFHRRNIFDEFKLIPVDEKVEIDIWRNGKEKKISANTQPYPEFKLDSIPIITDREFVDVWGMTIQKLSYEILEAFNLFDKITFYQLVRDFNEQNERVIITHIEKESPAYLQEWSPGEVISEVNGKKVNNLKTLIELLSDDSEIFKIKSETGSVGFFNGKDLKGGIKLLNPSMFLK